MRRRGEERRRRRGRGEEVEKTLIDLYVYM